MSNIYDLFETSANLENDGVELDFGDFQITVASAGSGNAKYVQKLEEIERRYRTQLRSQTLSAEQNMDILRRAYAEAVVLDWKGVKDRSGKTLKFSPDACFDLFKDMPAFFQTVRDYAEDWKNFRSTMLEEEEKNSDTASDGT